MKQRGQHRKARASQAPRAATQGHEPHPQRRMASPATRGDHTAKAALQGTTTPGQRREAIEQLWMDTTDAQVGFLQYELLSTVLRMSALNIASLALA